MNWIRIVLVWLMIVVAETIHGILRQIFIAPMIGDFPSRQWGVLVGSLIIFIITYLSIRWLNPKTFAQQMRIGLVWVVLMVMFEIGLGLGLGFPLERIAQDYNVTQGGWMGLGLLFMLFTPALAWRLRMRMAGAG